MLTNNSWVTLRVCIQTFVCEDKWTWKLAVYNIWVLCESGDLLWNDYNISSSSIVKGHYGGMEVACLSYAMLRNHEML